MSRRTSHNDQGLTATLSSLQFGIVLLIAIAAVSVVGTLIPQGQPPGFYVERYNPLVSFIIRVFRFDTTYSSPLFIGLLGLFAINITLCSVIRFPRRLKNTFAPDRAPSASVMKSMPVHETKSGLALDDVRASFNGAGFRLGDAGEGRLYGEKGRMGSLGASLVHISILVLLAGGAASLLTGVRSSIVLEPGDTTSVVTLPGGQTIDLGFTLTLDRFDVEFYESHPGRPRSFTSSVLVGLPDGGSLRRDISVNHPLMRNGFTIYQSSYGLSEPEATVPAGNDTAIVDISLKGTPETVPPITTMTMTAGGLHTIPGFGDSVAVRAAEIHRDFRRGGGGMTTEANPAVKLDVLINGEPRWSVYAFRNFPGLNMPMNSEVRFLFTMRELRTSGGDSVDAVAGGQDYYTVLGVVRDGGIPVMAVGGLLMMAGLFLSFYVRPRRVWVRADESAGTVTVSATTKGDPSRFRTFIRDRLRMAAGK